MASYEQVIHSLQHLITKREAAHKKRVTDKRFDEEGNVIAQEWTLTQLHIVAVMKAEKMANNRMLAEKLDLTRAAITKATKKLLKQEIMIEKELKDNKKEIYYTLTESGERLALLHEQLHEKAKQKYIDILQEFSDEELAVINRFLKSIANNL
ncbi:MarR family transcriptional regulator [Bacillus chungangensis]|uniref:DNA-binding MarR family transcriptional regulator n=1 Tax=Bacillus chungangensis TaxID=587633 RepID=A0ABT9WV77_9BACI|nr:MarR family transcriptional regulator [Bacillus chungangensis]MDQ0177206.1 DNA-binding MarR family transcriptional regulator [Bacillus chungangensis]